jgi:membrane protein DedA with SNARE-associated domain
MLCTGGCPVEEFLQSWSYLGIFLGILSTGVGFPMPEELPIVVAGGLVAHGSANFWMLPVCIIAVVIGDGLLYGIGWLWGPRLLTYSWVKKHILPPDRLASIERNFHEHGIKILLFARLTPGIRAPIFLTAGLIRLSLSRFLLADGLYAIPGVAVLFFLGYFFTDSMVNLIRHEFANVKYIIILVVVVAVAGYFAYRFLRRPMVTGGPEEVPPLVEKVTHTIEGVTHTLENVTTKIIHPKGGKAPSEPCPPRDTSAPGQAGGQPPAASVDGQPPQGRADPRRD